MKLTIKPIALLLALCACVSSASAANISYTGEFAYDNEVKLFQFTVDTLSTVGLRTWSYAGGINAAGETIARGGFDPIVALFNSAGQLIGEQDDGGCRKVAADALTRQCWDINYSIELAPGTYTRRSSNTIITTSATTWRTASITRTSSTATSATVSCMKWTSSATVPGPSIC
ncbi:DVUA0089 family protein [Massilia varians]